MQFCFVTFRCIIRFLAAQNPSSYSLVGVIFCTSGSIWCALSCIPEMLSQNCTFGDYLNFGARYHNPEEKGISMQPARMPYIVLSFNNITSQVFHVVYEQMSFFSVELPKTHVKVPGQYQSAFNRYGTRRKKLLNDSALHVMKPPFTFSLTPTEADQSLEDLILNVVAQEIFNIAGECKLMSSYQIDIESFISDSEAYDAVDEEVLNGGAINRVAAPSQARVKKKFTTGILTQPCFMQAKFRFLEWAQLNLPSVHEGIEEDLEESKFPYGLIQHTRGSDSMTKLIALDQYYDEGKCQFLSFEDADDLLVRPPKPKTPIQFSKSSKRNIIYKNWSQINTWKLIDRLPPRVIAKKLSLDARYFARAYSEIRQECKFALNVKDRCHEKVQRERQVLKTLLEPLIDQMLGTVFSVKDLQSKLLDIGAPPCIVGRHRILYVMKNMLKLRRKRPSLRFTLGNEQQLTNQINSFVKYLDILRSMGRKLVFIDECNVNASSFKKQVWAKIGQQISVKTFRKQDSITLVVAATESQVICLEGLTGGVTNIIMEQFMKQLINVLDGSLGVAKKDAVIVFDNVKPHLSKPMKDLLDKERLLALTCPPYHPELNMVELVFRYIKLNLRPEHLKNKDSMMERCLGILGRMGEDKMKKISEDWCQCMRKAYKREIQTNEERKDGSE